MANGQLDAMGPAQGLAPALLPLPLPAAAAAAAAAPPAAVSAAALLQPQLSQGDRALMAQLQPGAALLPLVDGAHCLMVERALTPQRSFGAATGSFYLLEIAELEGKGGYGDVHIVHILKWMPPMVGEELQPWQEWAGELQAIKVAHTWQDVPASRRAQFADCEVTYLQQQLRDTALEAHVAALTASSPYTVDSQTAGELLVLPAQALAGGSLPSAVVLRLVMRALQPGPLAEAPWCQRPCLMMELADCSLADLLADAVLMPHIHRAGLAPSLLFDVLSAASALHEANVLHLDIKPANLLVFEIDSGHPRVRIADFGAAHILRSAGDKGLNRVFTRACAAPEQLMGGANISAAADIFAVGLVGCYVLSGLDPPNALVKGESWRDVADPVRTLAMMNSCLQPQQRMSDDAMALVASCCQPSPARRGTAEELLANPLMKAVAAARGKAAKQGQQMG